MDNNLLTALDQLNFREWTERTSDTKKCVDFCQRVGLIGFTLNDGCAKDHKNWKLGASSRMSDGWVWRCSRCKSTRSIRHGTFFANSKLSIHQVLDLMFFWSQRLDSHSFLRRHCEFASEATIVDWKNFVRDICGEYFVRHPQVIEGVGRIVEIDESAWTTRKFNRGRQVSNQWVFGGIDRDSRDCFAVMVDHRDAATLLPIINQYILPGTTIFSDQWAAYNGIANGPHPQKYVHLTVKHSQNFVDPVTRTHTQNIENLWMCMKIKKKAQMGQHVSLLDTHLIEFMWRRRFGDQPLEYLVRAIHEKYPV